MLDTSNLEDYLLNSDSKVKLIFEYNKKVVPTLIKLIKPKKLIV